MKLYWGFLALLGTFVLLILFLADQERKSGVERLSRYNAVPQAAREDQPGLRQQSERSLYMRDERY
jgi:hypothetical protein